MAQINVKRNSGWAEIRLDRPDKRNALGEEILTQLNDAIASFVDDEDTRVIVLSATAPIFSAGAESKIKSDSSAEEKRTAFKGAKSQFRRLFERATSSFEQLEQITVAKINGHAIGAGWGLTLACDFRYAARQAQFWIPEVDLGVLLGVGTTTRMVRLIGAARTKEIVLGGRRYDATALKDIGLLTEVVDSGELDEEVHKYVEFLLAKPFLPLAQMKSRIDHIARTAVPEAASVIETILPRKDS
ncbi:enoyl-CoA hydratase/isomerase family protein [Hoeflea sp. CAU 1731]